MESAQIYKSINLSKYFIIDLQEQISNFYNKKEIEWIKLVGKERWFALPEEKRKFLINTAGIIQIGENIDIEKAFKYYE